MVATQSISVQSLRTAINAVQTKIELKKSYFSTIGNIKKFRLSSKNYHDAAKIFFVKE
jgi:hypothetical protein